RRSDRSAGPNIPYAHRPLRRSYPQPLAVRGERHVIRLAISIGRVGLTAGTKWRDDRDRLHDPKRGDVANHDLSVALRDREQTSRWRNCDEVRYRREAGVHVETA